MTYFGKNIKSLRIEHGYTQEEFGLLFGLSRDNINSYERGSLPNVEDYLKIMDHFHLDPSKFMNLDKERHLVSREVNDSSGNQEKLITDLIVDKGINEDEQFRYLADLNEEKLINLVRKNVVAKEVLLKENLELKNKNIALSEQIIELLKKLAD